MGWPKRVYGTTSTQSGSTLQAIDYWTVTIIVRNSPVCRPTTEAFLCHHAPSICELIKRPFSITDVWAQCHQLLPGKDLCHIGQVIPLRLVSLKPVVVWNPICIRYSCNSQWNRATDYHTLVKRLTNYSQHYISEIIFLSRICRVYPNMLNVTVPSSDGRCLMSARYGASEMTPKWQWQDQNNILCLLSIVVLFC